MNIRFAVHVVNSCLRLARLACWRKLRRKLRVLSEIELVHTVLSALQNPESSKLNHDHSCAGKRSLNTMRAYI